MAAWQLPQAGRHALMATIIWVAFTLIYQVSTQLRIDIGANDTGYISGFNDKEQMADGSFRWSMGQSHIEMTGVGGGQYNLIVGLAAPRPDGAEQPRVELWLDDQLLDIFLAQPTYQRRLYSVAIDWSAQGTRKITVISDTIADPTANQRRLGVALDEIMLVALSRPLLPPFWPLFFGWVCIWLGRRAAHAIIPRRPDVAVLGAIAALLATLFAFREAFSSLIYTLLVPLIFVNMLLWAYQSIIVHDYSVGWAMLALGALAYAALIAGRVLFFVPEVSSNRTDFDLFYQAGATVWQNQSELLYEYAAMVSRPFQVFKQPPHVAVLFAPFTLLSPNTALVTWRWLLVCFAIAAITLLTAHFSAHRLGKPSGWPALAFFCIALVFVPLHDSILYGQWDVPLLLLCSGALVALQQRRSVLAGGCIALATLIKLYPAYLIIFLVYKREWRVLMWYAISLVVMSLLAMLATGWQAHYTFFFEMLPVISGGTPWADNQTFFGFISRIAYPDLWRTSRPTPSGIVQWLSHGWSITLTTGLMAILQRYSSPNKLNYALGYALTLCTMLVIIPVAWIHYEALLLISILILLLAVAEKEALAHPWSIVVAGSIGLLTFGNHKTLLNPLFFGNTVGLTLISTRFFAQLGLIAVLIHLMMSTRKRV